MAKKGFSVDQLQRPREQVVSPRSPAYELSTTQGVGDEAAPLPPEAADLSPQLRELALRYVGSRRRVGEALLEACRYMSEARSQAEEGQWYLFLRVTGTSPDQAEAQINIHLRVQQHPEFAEKVRSGWFNQTVAGELAKPSTPPEVLARLIEAPAPPRVADVKRARREFQKGEIPHNVDNPDYPGSPVAQEVEADVVEALAGAPEEHVTLVALLAEIAASLEAIAVQAHTLPLDERTLHALQRIEQGAAAIRRRMPVSE